MNENFDKSLYASVWRNVRVCTSSMKCVEERTRMYFKYEVCGGTYAYVLQVECNIILNNLYL